MGFCWIVASGPIQDLSTFHPASPPAESIRNLSILVIAITAFIFVVVEGVLIYSIIRFRQRGADSPVEIGRIRCRLCVA